jgi:hypothetical protein
MALFFFHVSENGAEILDHDGVEFPSLQEARAQAVVAAGEAIKDLGETFWRTEAWHMSVTDESGATVCTLDVAGR